MKIIWTLTIMSALIIPRVAYAQGTDCNALARDMVIKNYQSSWSDYSKLLFLSSLTQMDENTSKEALNHSGKVSVGPISIGPGTWNKEKQAELRSQLQKFLSVDKLNSSAASVAVSTGDPSVGKAVEACLFQNGGLIIRLNDIGKNIATATFTWVSPPGGGKGSTAIDDVAIANGKATGGLAYTRKGAKLIDRLPQRIMVTRNDPKLETVVIVNLQGGGSAEAYLPPAELPPPPPPKIVRVGIEDKTPRKISSGGGSPGPYCQKRSVVSCVEPQHGGKIVPKSGKPKIIYSNSGDRTGAEKPDESPEKYCVTFWASTGACETEITITGVATATEEYTESK